MELARLGQLVGMKVCLLRCGLKGRAKLTARIDDHHGYATARLIRTHSHPR